MVTVKESRNFSYSLMNLPAIALSITLPQQPRFTPQS
jgi:hypothetical protein